MVLNTISNVLFGRKWETEEKKKPELKTWELTGKGQAAVSILYRGEILSTTFVNVRAKYDYAKDQTSYFPDRTKIKFFEGFAGTRKVDAWSVYIPELKRYSPRPTITKLEEEVKTTGTFSLDFPVQPLAITSWERGAV